MIPISMVPLERATQVARRSSPRPGYLLEAPDLEVAHRSAKWMARAMNCEEDPFPCERCSSCRRIASNTHPDVLEIDPDGAFIKVDQIRELIGELSYQRHDATTRLALILGAELMRSEAANALLKILEEPPPGTTFILATAAGPSLLPTLRSRCQELRLAPIATHLQARSLEAEGVSASEALQRVMYGGPEASPEIAQQRIELLTSYVQANSSDASAVAFAAELGSDRDALLEFLGDLQVLIHDAVLRRECPDRVVASPQELLRWVLARFQGDSLHRVAQSLERAEHQTRRNVQGRLILEALMLADPGKPT